MGGVALSTPGKVSAAVDTVKRWLADGADVDRDIVPSITAQFRDTKDPSIGSLNFYSGRIAKAVAQASGGPPSRQWTPEDQRAYLAKLGGQRAAP